MSEANRSFDEPVFVPRRPLPALALPKGKENTRWSALLSVLLHVLVIALLVTPFAAHELIVEREQGAGGPGPAGGGGGGRRGTGGERLEPRERLQFVRVQPKPAPAKAVPTSTPTPKPVVTPPVVPPPKPVEIKQPDPPKVEKPLEQVAPAKAAPDVSQVPGTGGGSGSDGTNGSGPGSGGGVGTGVGTGRGSAVGPGTGGGPGVNYPPTAIEIFLPPMPVPDKVKGFHLVAEFDVDEAGKVLAFDFTPTRDGDYNKKLREVFKGFRFRPGTRPDGTPLRMKAQVAVDIF